MRRLKLLLPLLALNSSPVATASALDDEHLDCLIEPNQVVELGTSVPGVVDRVLVERADTIVTGQPLVQLESSVEKATLRHAEERAAMDGTIQAHRADMNLAHQNLKRIEKLFKRQAVSSQQRDEARAEYEVARRNYQVAQENKRLAQLEFETYQAKLERRVVRSPIDGVVIERLSVAGEFVDERPLLTLAQLDPLRVEVLIPATLFGSIHPGMRAEINPEVPVNSELKANVITVDRLIDSASGTFRVSLELPNPGQRIPGGLKCGVRFLPRVADQDPPSEVDSVVAETAPIPEQRVSLPKGTPVIAEIPQTNQKPQPETNPLDSQSPVPTAAIEHASEAAPRPPVALVPVATINRSPAPVEDTNISVQPEPIELTSDANEADHPSPELIEPLSASTPLPALADALDTNVQSEPTEIGSDANEADQLPLPIIEPLIETVAVNNPLPDPGEEAATAAPSEPVDVPPVRWCGSLRTSTPAGILERHIRRLRAADIEVSRDEFVGSVPRDFVVEMPLENGSCKKTLGELRTAGFPDVACYRSKKTNRWIVSGGLFKKEEYARTRQQKMAAKGFKVALRTRYRTHRSQTLYLEAGSHSLVTAMLHKLQLDPGAQLKETPCGGDALAKR